MSDLSSPPQRPAGTDPGAPPLSPSVWPLPSGSRYSQPVEPDGLISCIVVGLNDNRMKGRLRRFVPQESTAQVQIPPSRAVLPLRFDQFRSLMLTAPLRRIVEGEDRRVAERRGATPSSAPMTTSYTVVLDNGEQVAGETVGHVENEAGLFLFPVDPADPSQVRRTFFPRAAYAHWTLGGTVRSGSASARMELSLASPSSLAEARAMAKVQAAAAPEATSDILSIGLARTPDELLRAVARQANMPMVRIGEALMSLGLVTQVQLSAALERQPDDRGVPLGEILVRMGSVSREDLRVALAHKMGYPIVDVDAFACDPVAVARLPYAVASRLQVIPLLVNEQRLVVALEDPAGRRSALDEIEFSVQMKIVPVLAQCRSFDDALWGAYERTGESGPRDGGGRAHQGDTADTGKLVEVLEREGLDASEAGGHDERSIEQSDNSLVRLINSIVIDAHKDGVSDIHIESYPGKEKTRVRFRKDGRMRTHLELPYNYRSAMIARIKIMCDLDIAERRKPQDGKIAFAKFSPQHKIELRVATIPTTGGLEDVVLRILASAKPLPVSKLGLSPWNLKGLTHAVERPYGLVLCVGPTGSGKTTTLHSVLSHINVPERKIWTAEDPIEITQAGLRQVQVNPKIDWTFAKALRAFLRADPDAIMVGEIRDQETAHMAVEASLTGHLVLSTLHTNSAPETVTRLLDMGLDPFNFADSLLAVLAQRLVRRLCTACRVSEPATRAQLDELLHDHLHAYGAAVKPNPETVLAEWTEQYGTEGRLMAHHCPGCKQCDHTGFKGRAGMHELMTVTRGLRQLVQSSARAEELQAMALSEGMRTLRQDGICKVLAGVTAIEEVRSTSNG